jgi:hypothetical protein
MRAQKSPVKYRVSKRTDRSETINKKISVHASVQSATNLIVKIVISVCQITSQSSLDPSAKYSKSSITTNMRTQVSTSSI